MEIQMIIYPLPPQELDDKTLARQIKAIAQTLCNVHHANVLRQPHQRWIELHSKIPLFCVGSRNAIKLVDWASTCVANYKNLLEMGLACCEEYTYRFSETGFTAADVFYHGIVKKHKLQPVIEWAASHIPNLPE